MKLNPIFDYVKLKRQTSETGSRQYIEPNGNKVYSVTTILAATADMTGLKKWQERVGLVEANRIRNEAAGLGTLLHDHLEKHVKSEVRPTGTNMVRLMAKNMADQVINRGLTNVDEVWGLEESLYCTGLYAGTTDLCGVHKGDPTVVDYKTATKMKKLEYINDYLVQVAAYGTSHNEMFNTKIRKGVIFMVDRNLNFEEFILEGREFDQKQQEWLKRLESFLISKY